MHGLLLIDKPCGMTSHDVVSRVRRICNTRKVGHAGTLDPMATGVLPIAVGQATKALQFLLIADKSYRATLHLGVETETLDAEGAVVDETDVPTDAAEQLIDILPDFQGEIQQTPPMFSALKQNGVPLYKLARQGQTVEREARTVQIDRLQILSVTLPSVEIEVDCSKGTYIRTLAADLGRVIGCGAHLSSLRRLRTGPFAVEQCTPLEVLLDGTVDPTDVLLSVEETLAFYPPAVLSDRAAQRLRFGISPEAGELTCEHPLEENRLVRLMEGDLLIAMARYVPQERSDKAGDFELVRVFHGA